MVHCGACGKFLPSSGGAACSVCFLKSHKACLNIPEKATISKEWACLGCKKSSRKGDNTPVKSICDSPPGSNVSAESHGNASMDESRHREFTDFMREMREFRREMRELRESFIARLDSVEIRLDALEQQRQDAGADGADELRRTIEHLKQDLNDREQEALLSDLEIGQMVEEKGVSVMQSVVVLASRLGVSLEERDIVFAERVGPPSAEAGGRPRCITVRLTRRHLRDELLRAARVRRSLTGAAGGRIYLNERLTRSNRQLFHRVREECRKQQWRYSRTKRGRIYARKADGSQVYQFRSVADLERVFCVSQKA
ncbi:unnamed protein product [Diatraea saccharalis]|uniref:FP protein C-terminal domain-containing protein n=1 Tax=Diatraea saccharalis TaxID=40085 RepID=A0A9N9RGV1_9NEOP|nr:unnamed protein product [Diatraea saccharalis]